MTNLDQLRAIVNDAVRLKVVGELGHEKAMRAIVTDEDQAVADLLRDTPDVCSVKRDTLVMLVRSAFLGGVATAVESVQPSEI